MIKNQFYNFEQWFNNKPVQVKPSSDDKTRQLISFLDSGAAKKILSRRAQKN